MIVALRCPICSTINKREYYTEDYSIVEEHYFCNNCGYFFEMSYSPFREGIDTMYGTEEDRKRKEKLVDQYADKIKRLGLKINGMR